MLTHTHTPTHWQRPQIDGPIWKLIKPTSLNCIMQKYVSTGNCVYQRKMFRICISFRTDVVHFKFYLIFLLPLRLFLLFARLSRYSLTDYFHYSIRRRWRLIVVKHLADFSNQNREVLIPLRGFWFHFHFGFFPQIFKEERERERKNEESKLWALNMGNQSMAKSGKTRTLHSIRRRLSECCQKNWTNFMKHFH